MLSTVLGSSCPVPSLFCSENHGSHSCVYLTMQYAVLLLQSAFLHSNLQQGENKRTGFLQEQFLNVAQTTSLCMCCVDSAMSDSLGPPWTVAHKSPLSVGFSRQEHWSGLPCPPPDLCDPSIELVSFMSPSLAGGIFTTHSIWEAPLCISLIKY